MQFIISLPADCFSLQRIMIRVIIKPQAWDYQIELLLLQSASRNQSLLKINPTHTSCPMNPAQLAAVSIGDLSSKIQSKKELYQFLVMDCSAYLPPIKSTNVYYFKAIIRGDKDYIKRDQVMISAVPQIEGLTIEDILDFSKGQARLIKHLPDERDWVHIDRKWMCDVIFTLEKVAFTAFVTIAMKARKAKAEVSKSLLVEMRPEFAQALNSCLNYSVQNGRSACLLKGASKRKRTKEQIEEVKQEEDALKEDRQEFLQMVRRMKDEKAELEAALDEISRQSVHNAQARLASDQRPASQSFNI